MKNTSQTMTTNKVSPGASPIESLARERFAERLIKKMSPSLPKEDADDLSQIVYTSLLDKDKDFVRGLEERGELDFYVIRIIQRQLYSVTSPFYRKIRKFRDNTSPIDTAYIDYSDKNKLSSDEY